MKDLIRSVGLTFLLDHKVMRSPWCVNPVTPVFVSACDFNVVQGQVAAYTFAFPHPVAVQLPWQAVEGGR